MCNGIVCNCNDVTHGPAWVDDQKTECCSGGTGCPNTTIYPNTISYGTFSTERPGEQIKRRVEETREEIKRMLNSLVDELGVQIEEIYVEVEDKTKITDVSIYWYVEEN